MYNAKEIFKAGTKIVVGMDAGLAGTDSMEAYVLMSDWTREELDDFAWTRGLEHADMYGIYPTSDMPEDYDEDEEPDGDSYSDNIDGWWEIYNPDEHDGKCIRGNDTEVNFHQI